jgi:hypothetical protein
LEAEEFNDNNDFFKPKGIKQRIKKQEEERKILCSKIELGLENIRTAYKNKEWKSEPEKLFLEIFSKFSLDKEYDKNWEGCYLLDGDNKRRVFWDLKHYDFCLSYGYIWDIFQNKFDWNYDEVQSFMKDMLNEYFKLGSFTSFKFF